MSDPAILVIGADGTIGSALGQRLTGHAPGPLLQTTRREDLVQGPGRIFLDLAAPVSSWQLPAQVSTAFIAAGETSLARCRQFPVQSRLVNVDRTIALARILVARGARVFFLSSNQVFDGTKPRRLPDEPTCPQSEYGRQKACAEEALLSLSEAVVIVRLTKVLSKRSSLLGQWIKSMRANEAIRPYADMVMAPVSLAIVTDALVRLLDTDVHGIIQLSAAVDISYEAAARFLAEGLGANEDLVQATRFTESCCGDQPGDAGEMLPLHTTLDSTRLESVLGLSVPDVWSSLTWFVEHQ